MAVEIVYETHALTTDNEQGVATGWQPGRLSELGRENARDLGERRRPDGISAVFSSDLARAVQTAEIAFAGTDTPIYQDRRLRECNYGALNGMPTTQLAEIKSRHIQEPYPDGQSYQDVVQLTREFLVEVAGNWDGRKILIIAHSANRWALENLLHGVTLDELVAAPFAWQEGWHYTLPTGWGGTHA